MNHKRIAWGSVLKYAVLIFMLFITILPLLCAIGGSFKTNMEILSNGRIFAKTPTFDNYIKAWTSPDFQVGKLVINSLIYTLLNLLIVITSSSMCGYVFARGNFPLKKTIFLCFTSLMFIKTGGIGIYATFDVLNFLHIKRSLWSLVFVHLFNVPIIQMYLVKSYVDTLPNEIFEAAKIDGGSFFTIYAKIVLPLLKPVMATIGLLAFQGSWNEYLMPTIFTLTEPRQRTLIVGLMSLKNSSGAAANWALMLAGSVIALVPVIFAYIVGNKYFVSGLTAGAVKG